ncbi:MATE family efflux transporter [Breznakiella homolactica]|uniref:Multidrug export protein MepA n=1 Tax=Breznakiella homolactica TaxID=2798577 RepID=A0A7T7XN42_9SPIR|nr:MATE family efflux transporter [Breznakiella homolactica]QQO09391.1 MATE family efflux transporter [Breznakiella homolactica]
MDSVNHENEKYFRMIETPVELLVCHLAVPAMVIMMISALYNMADTYFVGSLGTSATGAVGVVFPLMTIIQAMGFFFGNGSGTYISRQLGARDMERASKMAATGFVSALIGGTIVAAAGLIFLRPLAVLLGSTETILPYACDYLLFILIGTPWMAGSLVLNNQLRYQGSASSGMIGMLTGAILNIILDPLFIFVFDMGVQGASLATMISQLVSCIVLFMVSRREGNIPIRFRDFSPTLKNYREMLRGGLPSLFRQGISSTSAIFINQFAGFYGDAAIAGISIVTRVTMFASSALMGFGQGFQPVCGFNYGAKRYDRVKRAFWFCVKSSFLVLLATAAVLFVFSPQIIALFRKDDLEVISIGSLGLRLQCLTFPLSGWIILSNMLLQTIGKSFKASVMATSRQGFFLLPALFILGNAFGLLGIQLSQPAADIAAFFLAIPLVYGVFKEMNVQEAAGTIGQAERTDPDPPQL